LFNDRGVMALGPKGVHMSLRRGPPIWDVRCALGQPCCFDVEGSPLICRQPDMTDLYCMSFTSRGASEILVAGCQDTMFVIDVNKGETTKEVRTAALDEENIR